MRLTLWLLGHEVISISTDAGPDEDKARDLSGGTLSAHPIDAGATDLFLGFTNGRSSDD